MNSCRSWPVKRSRSRSGITLRDRDRQSSLTIHVCFLHETQFVRTNNANMEEAGILEKITRSGFCYPALNQVRFSPVTATQSLGPRKSGADDCDAASYRGKRSESGFQIGPGSVLRRNREARSRTFPAVCTRVDVDISSMPFNAVQDFVRICARARRRLWRRVSRASFKTAIRA